MAWFGKHGGHRRTGALLGLITALGAAGQAWGITANGNEFALWLSEPQSRGALKQIIDEAMGKQHFFRYLHITKMEAGDADGCPFVEVHTYEPGSNWEVRFRVLKSLSLAKLKESPPSGVGDCLAVSGVVRKVDPEAKMIILNPVIVRFKDRAAPKVGKEFLHEVDASAIVYSFTGGKEAVNVSRRDADLLQHESKILAERGKDGWARFLLEEIAKRDKAEKAARDKLDIYRKPVEDPAEGPAATDMPPPPVIVNDEE